MDIKVGDIVVLNDGQILLMTNMEDIKHIQATLKTVKEVKVVRIERPVYKNIFKKVELLSKEDKEFLKYYIRTVENLDNGKVIKLRRTEQSIVLVLRTGLEYKMEIGPAFSNLANNRMYDIEDLELD